ncbi:uncharacterized protein [Dermacentor andersoni]|uniref:uncharacterized protein isoform X2 n=1 Tax=Dermacentor andersoni TaxID=34620 RepID=UPI002416BC9F|nr:uncharacterized protein LOC126538671 isoform X2 [Dermacentor andersoni]
MPASCCASGCSNSVTRGKRLFRIPLSEKDSARREVWLAIIKRQGFVPTTGSRLCEDHFEPDQFEQCRADGRKLLKHNAVPTIPGSAIPTGQKRGRRRNRRAPTATKRRRSPSDSVDDGDSEGEEEVDCSSGPEAAEAAHVAESAETCGVSDWADALTCKALQIRLAAGQRGYAVVREMCLGFPSELQLRQCVEALPFEPGLLDGLLPALEHKVSTMGPEDRHVALWLERVAVLPGSGPTLGGTDDESSGDALVFSIAGLASYWKQTLGYHLLTELASSTSTGGSALCGMLKNAIFQVVRKCEALGLAIDALVTDLSALSLSLWELCRVSTRPVRRPVFSTRHPCTTAEQSDHRWLMILADLPYSVILLALVDHQYWFRYINVGAPGRCHDANVYGRSKLHTLIESGHLDSPVIMIEGAAITPLILCDQAFPLTATLLKPFPSASPGTPEAACNYNLSKTRRIVENAFGRLKARFRFVMKRLECKLPNAKQAIRAACVLHNICETFRDPVDPQWEQDVPAFDELFPQPSRSTTQSSETGHSVRAALAQYFWRRAQQVT